MKAIKNSEVVARAKLAKPSSSVSGPRVEDPDDDVLALTEQICGVDIDVLEDN